MASYYFQFTTVSIIFLFGVQEGLLVPSPIDNSIGHLNKMFDIDVLLNRLDQLEAKNEQYEVKVAELEAKVAEQEEKVAEQEAKVAEHEVMVSLVNQHEIKINSQQEEIELLKKKNSELTEEKNIKPLVQTGNDVISRNFMPRSCFELKATSPSAQSGVYTIDPDGQIGGDPSIQVYCDMTTQTTSIYHDTEAKTDITACPDPGCYTKAIKYNATIRQMLNLADISASCKQYFKFDSFVVPLEYNLTQFGYWNDRNSNKQIFWAGSATSSHTCQCGISNNCIEKNFKCNADSLAPIQLVDDGFITATELLPVTRLNFGRTSLTGVKASYTLGRFECTGQVAISSKPSNCRDLFKMGHTLSGFYDVKSSSSQIASIYCDFSKSSTETGYETRYGFIDVKSSPVHFFVTRTSSWTGDNTIMRFEKEYLNLGGGMNLATGIFTVPKAGIYAFAFKGLGLGSSSIGYGFAHLQRNGADVARGFFSINSATSGYSTLSVHGTMKLNKGDAITIRNIAGTVYSDGSSHIQFTGSLIEEDLIIS